MKKCLLLIPRMGNGGAERVMATIANNLCSEHEVRIVTMTDDAESFYSLDERVSIAGLGQGVNRKNKLTKLFSMAFGGIKVFFALRREIKAWKPDVVVSFLGPANVLVLLLKLLGTKCRVIVSERCDPMARGKVYRWFEKNFYPKADMVVCQSKTAAAFFGDKNKYKVEVIPNPISADAIPERYTGERRKTVVGVGRLDTQKNFTMLIETFSRLPQKFNNYTLEIYGGGVLEQSLRSLIKELGLENRVFLMGVKQNVMHYISDVALYVMSSNYEGFPNALVEAMATGLPVISTDFPTGVAREVISNKNGWVIPVGDGDALLVAMETALSDESHWNEISLENRKLLEELSEARVIEKWKAVLFPTSE